MSHPSRPSSSQASHGPPRMPIEAAEALLWGKATRDEQKRLHSRVHELMQQHQNYETRIQSTEAIAKAAEAATARIRSIEQKVKAIESDEHDRPFDKWAEAEIETFKIFIEKNKNVRQKQLELERQVSSFDDHIDKVSTDASREVEILQARLGRLESNRINDANIIKNLERDVANLKTMRQGYSAEVDVQRAMGMPDYAPRQMIPSTLRQQDVLRSIDTSKVSATNIAPNGVNSRLTPNGVNSRLTPMKMTRPPPKAKPVSSTTRNEDMRMPMGAGKSDLNHMAAPPLIYQASNAPVATSLVMGPGIPHPNLRGPHPGRAVPPQARESHIEDSDTEDEIFGTPNESMHTYHEQTHPHRKIDDMPTPTGSKLVSSPTKPAGDMSARFRMMQRPSIHEPKRSREIGGRGEDSAVRAPSQNTLSGDQLPPTQIVNRVEAAQPPRTTSPVEFPPQNVQPEALAQLIVILSPGKRKLGELNALPQQQKPDKPIQTPRQKKLKAPAPTPRQMEPKEPAPSPRKKPLKETIQTPRRKKLPDPAQTPRETRSKAKQKRKAIHVLAKDSAAEQNNQNVNEQVVEERSSKRRRLENSPIPPQAPSQQHEANTDLRMGSNEKIQAPPTPRKAVQFVGVTPRRPGLTKGGSNKSLSAESSTTKAAQVVSSTPRRSSRLNRRSSQKSKPIDELPGPHTPPRSAFEHPSRPWRTPKGKGVAMPSTPEDDLQTQSPDFQPELKAVSSKKARSPVKSGKVRKSRLSPVKGTRNGDVRTESARASNTAAR